jgi:ribosomal protein S18 acetylase RimI-like enzyme
VTDAIAHELYQVASTPEDSAIFIAQGIDSRQLGFIYLQTATDLFTHERHGHISDIAVTSGDGGQGVGQALLQVAEDWARNQGYRLLSLRAIAGNTPVRSFYNRFGYEEDMVKYIKILN